MYEDTSSVRNNPDLHPQIRLRVIFYTYNFIIKLKQYLLAINNRTIKFTSIKPVNVFGTKCLNNKSKYKETITYLSKWVKM